nr:uncharacterized protein LOC107440739 isoform X2 [Parasteatoda tepidariorum]
MASKIRHDIFVNMADEISAPVEIKSVDEENSCEKPKISSLVTQLTEDYSKYLQVNAASEKAVLNDEVEDILTRLDEFTSLVDMEMLKVVKQNLDVLEEKVNVAEEQLESSSVKKLFNTLQKPLFSKKTNEPKKNIKYEPPEIFKAEVFFSDSTQSNENSAITP